MLAAVKLRDSSWAARTLTRGGTGPRGKGPTARGTSAAGAMQGQGAFTVSTGMCIISLSHTHTHIYIYTHCSSLYCQHRCVCVRCKHTVCVHTWITQSDTRASTVSTGLCTRAHTYTIRADCA